MENVNRTWLNDHFWLMGMRFIPIIICIMVLMLSCGNKNKVQDDSLDWECLDSIHKVQQKEYEAKEVDKSQYPGKPSILPYLPSNPA